ncbi:ABC transporter permease [Sulfuricurvum sp.]|uniref:ABC transporter permease n=1 Tax=Sulfuricurvum sp. TaxID=2025608 RepID=UPI00286D7EFC|nr:iron export ABC transporter permease subunit FetB [Sulfuricurvum sp.]
MQYSFLASYLLIIFALWYSRRENFGLEKTILTNSILAMVQLGLLGYALVYLFKIEHPSLLFFVLLGMVTFGAYTARKRTPLGEDSFKIAFFTLGASSGIVFLSMMAFGVIHMVPHEMIPIGGMIIGNALNVYTQSTERFRAEVKNTIEIIEGMVALGAPLKEALRFASKASVKASMIPTLNMLQTVGIIHIPGITTGMLLAGADPLSAISYQLAVMYMMVAVALLSAVFSTMFSYRVIIGSAFSNIKN